MNHKTNLGIRAVLHTARKWKKTLLVFFLLLAITTLVMSGLAIADAQEEQSEELRGVTGASFTVNANNGYTLQPVTDEMIEEIAAIDGVESYNTSHWTIVNLYHQDTLMKGTDEREYVADLFYGTGCFDSEYSPLFLSGALRLTEGCHVTEGNSGIILYEGLAEKYGLSLGDTLEIKNGNPDDPLVECEIAGLFEVIADDDDEQATMAKPSTLYDYENYIFTDMDIAWLVLEVKDGKALVVSKYALDCKQYNTSNTDVTWETCTLRKWLNNDFINAAFSSYEKAMIPTVTVSADKNSTNPGNATQDQVFLLSITEANKYFGSDSARQCKPTDYAFANGAYFNSVNGNCWWWLRPPGVTQYSAHSAAYVHSSGGVYESGSDVDIGTSAVRPAMWISLK